MGASREIRPQNPVLVKLNHNELLTYPNSTIRFILAR